MIRRGHLGLSPGGFHRLSYTLWEPEGGMVPGARTAVCVHGLTRNARDFDFLAACLAEAGLRVACPDVVGRGESGRLADPEGYGTPQYAADLNALLAQLNVTAVDWIGTSMGGLIGMWMAAQPGTPIERLVLNDIGPFIPKLALERIAAYVGSEPQFADLGEAEAHFREIHAPFGLTDPQWRHLAEHSIRPAEAGGFRVHYDTRLAAPMGSGPFEDLDFWALWDAIACPVLVLRGAKSDLLLPETAEEMTRRGPETRLVEIPGCGHAPGLMDPDQTALVREWLLGEGA
jgi:pimeloyl-ACP methyl ester carboxylesterase